MPTDLTPMDRQTKLAQIDQLTTLNSNLETIGTEIKTITEDNIKIRNLTIPLDIYFSDPNIFSQAISRLDPTERSTLLSISNLSNISKSSSPSLLPNIQNILNNIPPTLSESDIKTGLQSLLDSNISAFEQKRKDYDDLNIKIKELETINPLDFLLFQYDAKTLGDVFSLNTNQLTKIITKFFIQSLKETTRPLIKIRKGSLDFPRTIKSSMRYEGTPYELKFRSKAQRLRTVRPKIYFLLDISGSQDHGIYMSIPIVYAIISVLKEYDIILYTSSEYTHSNDYKNIQDAELKDLTDQRVAGDYTLRFNKKTLLKYINNPHALFKTIYRNSGASYTANDHYFILKSLSEVIPDDSIIICLSDQGQVPSVKFNDSVPQRARNNMKQKLKGKVFAFNTVYPWDPYSITNLSNKFNFKPLSPRNFNYEDIIFFPTEPYTNSHPNLTYGDWSREILRIISGFTRKT